MRKSKSKAEDYPDRDGDGVPDAFQNRKPVSEILGFGKIESKPEPKIAGSDEVIIKKITYEAMLVTIDNYRKITSKQHTEIQNKDAAIKQWREIAEKHNPCQHQNSDGKTYPYLICKHVLGGVASSYGKSWGPSTTNGYLYIIVCTAANHRAEEFEIRCDLCVPENLRNQIALIPS